MMCTHGTRLRTQNWGISIVDALGGFFRIYFF